MKRQTRASSLCLLGIVVLWTAGTGMALAQIQPLADVNAKIARWGGEGQTASPASRIGPGDVLNIRVFQVAELTGDYAVEYDGSLLLPFVDEKIVASGKSATELAQEIELLLQKRNLVNDPQVVVTVKEYHSGPVAVVGAVRQPTVFQAPHPISLLATLARAGGLAADAANQVIIRRGKEAAPSVSSPSADGQTITVDLDRLLGGQDASLDIPIFGGDTVTVPQAGVVYVLGAVRRPGGFALRNGDEQMTALKALALAEDLKPTAQPKKSAIIRRFASQDSETTIPLDLSKVLAGKLPNPPLKANDILFVPDSSGKKAMLRAAEAAIQITTGLVIWRR